MIRLLLLFISLCAAEAPVNLNPLVVREVKIQTPTENKRGLVTVFFTLAPDHHAYIQQFKLKLESPVEIFLSESIVDPIVDFYDPVSKKQKKGTEGNGTLVSTLEIPDAFRASAPNEVPLKMVLTYQACTKDYCLFPTKIPIEKTLYMSGEKRVTAAEKFATQINESFWLTLLLIFGAGILTSFTPCIFPMIPITLAVLGARDAGKTRLSGFVLSLSYVLGIALTYAILGVIAAKTGALFGSMLGSPVVAVFLAIVFIAMAFSMFGFYEIKLPDSLTNKLLGRSPSHTTHGVIGAFVTGLIAGIVASPCVGPVLVSILAYVAKSQDGKLGFLLLFVYALGFGQIFLALGTFGHLLKKIPRSGPWLDKTKHIFGTALIGMAIYVLWPVTKPYFPGQQKPTAAVSSLDFAQTCTAETLAKDNCATGGAAHAAHPDWEVYDDAKLATAIAAKRPVIIDFRADWCLACEELEEKTFSDPKVLAAGKTFLWLKFDATSDSPQLTALRAKYEILGLPYVTFYDNRGEWRKDLTLTGFEDADAFLMKMGQATK